MNSLKQSSQITAVSSSSAGDHRPRASAIASSSVRIFSQVPPQRAQVKVSVLTVLLYVLQRDLPA
jgi:hypothetical protein